MNIILVRIAKKANYTIGKLYLNNEYFCDTLEDTDRCLTQSMDLNSIRNKKIFGKTAIPMGTYKVTLDVVSPKYSQKTWYVENCNGGRVPRLLDVPGFDGILIHVGNDHTDTSGCILVGRNTQVGKVLESRDTFKKLYNELWKHKNETIKITIQ